MRGALFLMRKNRVFFQDYLFEGMPVDEQDNPTVSLEVFPKCMEIGERYAISLDKMLKMDKQKDWDNLFKYIKDRDVCIIDDVVLTNVELKPYKTFYLKTYCFNLSKYCRQVFIMDAMK